MVIKFSLKEKDFFKKKLLINIQVKHEIKTYYQVSQESLWITFETHYCSNKSLKNEQKV